MDAARTARAEAGGIDDSGLGTLESPNIRTHSAYLLRFLAPALFRFPQSLARELTGKLTRKPPLVLVRSPPMRFYSLSTAAAIVLLLTTSASPSFAEPPVTAPAAGSSPPSPGPPLTASVPHPYAYGILIGTNQGGAGQTELRYAEDDARKMASVLKELGRYGTTDMRVLVKPDPAKVLATVDEIGVKLRAHQAKGEQALLVFYYSGHAKANAFSLGNEEIPIATLREKLRALPTQLTLVVLDACQSGQFARIKGAEPAADFSFNSVSRLTTKGIAVMASSSAQELSQESDELKSSYFTHHLIVALRGAADADGDGKVSLDEAYRYAYRRTLVSTSQTKVGGQHVTLETDLAGQGDVPVTYPAIARSQLELPAQLDGRVLVQHKASGNIVAEVQKAPGSALKLAFASGVYEAIVRQSNAPTRAVYKCQLTLADAQVTSLDLGRCESIKLAGLAKGAFGEDGQEETVIPDNPDKPPAPPSSLAPWQLEVGIGSIWRAEDAYTRTLNEFGYRQETDFINPHFRFHAGGSKGILPHVSLGGYWHTLAGATYERRISDSSDSFSYDAYGLSAFVRFSQLIVGSSMSPNTDKPFVEIYAQAAFGLALGFTALKTGSPKAPTQGQETTDTAFGWVLGGHGGASVSLSRHLGLFVQGGYEYAPVFTNEIKETHNSGGPSTQVGLRARFE